MHVSWFTSTIENHVVYKNPLLDETRAATKSKYGHPPEQLLPLTWQRSDASWQRMLLFQPAVLLRHYAVPDSHTTFDTKASRCGHILEVLSKLYQDLAAQLCGTASFQRNGIKADLLGDHLWLSLECNDQIERLQSQHKSTLRKGNDLQT